MSSRDRWFREFERLDSEYDDKTEDELADMATEAIIDRMASEIDEARDRAKYGPWPRSKAEGEGG